MRLSSVGRLNQAMTDLGTHPWSTFMDHYEPRILVSEAANMLRSIFGILQGQVRDRNRFCLT